MFVKVLDQTVVVYPYGLADFRRDNPHTSLPDPLMPGDLSPFDVFEVAPTTKPTVNEAVAKVIEVAPVRNQDGAWQQTWDVVALTQAEQVAYVEQESAKLQKSIVDQTQARLDAFARTRGYDGILSAATYAASGNTQFAAEGQYCVGARDATWGALYAILAEVQAEPPLRPVPTSFADIEPDLPVLTWP